MSRISAGAGGVAGNVRSMANRAGFWKGGVAA